MTDPGLGQQFAVLRIESRPLHGLVIEDGGDDVILPLAKSKTFGLRNVRKNEGNVVRANPRPCAGREQGAAGSSRGPKSGWRARALSHAGSPTSRHVWSSVAARRRRCNPFRPARPADDEYRLARWPSPAIMAWALAAATRDHAEAAVEGTRHLVGFDAALGLEEPPVNGGGGQNRGVEQGLKCHRAEPGEYFRSRPPPVM